MLTTNLRRVTLGLVLAGITTACAGQADTAHGVVFHDANANGVRDDGERGIGEVRVSNGREVVKTDDDGAYAIEVDDDAVLFVIKPRDWMTPVGADGLPKFYYVHKPNGSSESLRFAGVPATGPLPDSVDFPLTPRKEPDRFSVIVFGDTQPRDLRDVHFLAHDVIPEVIRTVKRAEGGAAGKPPIGFGMTLGDIVFDDLSVFGPLNSVVGTIGVPWYNVCGNHDLNFDVTNDRDSDETFTRIYGPPYYAFDYGPVHFVVLENIHWQRESLGEPGRYTAGLGEQQLAFVRNDLRHVPKDRLVVLAMHIPLDELEERKALFRLLRDRPHTLSWSAHTHIQRHQFMGEEMDWSGAAPHHHLNFGTTCGSWWLGHPDELGIPHTTMRDGAPNCWHLVTFEGNEYVVDFHAVRRPDYHQMTIFAPDSVPAAGTGETEVIANVFAGSERSAVRMRVGQGEWRTMGKWLGLDPYYVAMKRREPEKDPPGGKLPDPRPSTHLWKARLPGDLGPGAHVIEVETTDMFDRTFREWRLIRVTE